MTHIAENIFAARLLAPRGWLAGAIDPEPKNSALAFSGSRFERLAARTDGLPAHFGTIFGLLLQGVSAPNDAGRQVLRPLWAEEGMHRAYAMLRLLHSQAERERGLAKGAFTVGVERSLARSLAAAYRSLAATAEDTQAPCSAVLQDVILNLGALFASDIGAGGGIVVRTFIERLSLPGYQRRALVLAASELMVNALTHAFHDASADARIDVSLHLLDRGWARLLVTDNGVGFGFRHHDPSSGIAGGLAGLLEADLTYARSAEWTTIADIIFPFRTALSKASEVSGWDA